MPAAIWMILYDLDQTHADEYLNWFNKVHIPEKLARPGYTWAAHYRFENSGQHANHRYIALFGGRDSRVFYHPSPSQIKPTQPPETRQMMAFRSNSQMFILAEEWSCSHRDESAVDPQVSADKICLSCFSSDHQDEDLNAWLVQEYLPLTSASGVCRKYLASSGETRHILIQENIPGEAPPILLQETGNSEWSEKLSRSLSFWQHQPCIAQRIWPGPDK